MEEKVVDNDEILKIVIEIRKLGKEDRYYNDSIKVLEKDYPDKNENLEETLLKYLVDIILKFWKQNFLIILSRFLKYLTKKLSYPYEYFNSLDVYQKPVDNVKRQDFFTKLKIDYTSDEERKRAKEINETVNIKNGEELSHLILKSDVFLTCMCFWKTYKSIKKRTWYQSSILC